MNKLVYGLTNRCFRPVTLFVWTSLFLGLFLATYPSDQAGICPYSQNNRYWQYDGQPVLLLGGSKDDNLFQSNDLKSHLEELASVGGNYIRNTMSSRDSGNVYPFLPLPDGQYDLDQWNPEYWNRFENLLTWAEELDVIIQIEVWDRFDFSQDFWQKSCWNPNNNITYTAEQTGLATSYPEHPWLDQQPFFHSIPGMPRNTTQLERVREYQEAFVDKILSYSLRFGNVLYCMDNETSTPPEWGKHWINYIRTRARKQGKAVFTTDMFDEFYKPRSCKVCQDLIRDPETYTFMDISQINSRNFGQNHWDTLQWIRVQARDYPRPINNTKVYGGGQSSWGSGTPEDGVERFCRNIVGGCAGARFHRPTAGSGLQPISKAAIQSFRKAETIMKLWDLEPNLELLTDRQPNEAYLAVDSSKSSFLVYFPKSGEVSVQTGSAKQLMVSWIRIGSGEWGPDADPVIGPLVNIRTPGEGGWLALLYMEQN